MCRCRDFFSRISAIELQRCILLDGCHCLSVFSFDELCVDKGLRRTIFQEEKIRRCKKSEINDNELESTASLSSFDMSEIRIFLVDESRSIR